MNGDVLLDSLDDDAHLVSNRSNDNCVDFSFNVPAEAVDDVVVDTVNTDICLVSSRSDNNYTDCVNSDVVCITDHNYVLTVDANDVCVTDIGVVESGVNDDSVVDVVTDVEVSVSNDPVVATNGDDVVNTDSVVLQQTDSVASVDSAVCDDAGADVDRAANIQDAAASKQVLCGMKAPLKAVSRGRPRGTKQYRCSGVPKSTTRKSHLQAILKVGTDVECILAKSQQIGLDDLRSDFDISVVHIAWNRFKLFFDDDAFNELTQRVAMLADLLNTCPVCSVPYDKSSGAKMVGCDTCKCCRWYHFQCVGLNRAPRSKEWFCYACK